MYIDDKVITKSSENNIYTFGILNDNLELTDSIVVDRIAINNTYEWKYMKYWKLTGKRVNAVYSVSKDIPNSESILLIFNT